MPIRRGCRNAHRAYLSVRDPVRLASCCKVGSPGRIQPTQTIWGSAPQDDRVSCREVSVYTVFVEVPGHSAQSRLSSTLDRYLPRSSQQAESVFFIVIIAKDIRTIKVFHQCRRHKLCERRELGKQRQEYRLVMLVKYLTLTRHIGDIKHLLAIL